MIFNIRVFQVQNAYFGEKLMVTITKNYYSRSKNNNARWRFSKMTVHCAVSHNIKSSIIKVLFSCVCAWNALILSLTYNYWYYTLITALYLTTSTSYLVKWITKMSFQRFLIATPLLKCLGVGDINWPLKNITYILSSWHDGLVLISSIYNTDA